MSEKPGDLKPPEEPKGVAPRDPGQVAAPGPWGRERPRRPDDVVAAPGPWGRERPGKDVINPPIDEDIIDRPGGSGGPGQ